MTEGAGSVQHAHMPHGLAFNRALRRQVYERAIAVVPPAQEKRYWQRYIYLWINYALWEELEADEPQRTREVYRAALKTIPHTQFTFAKVQAASLSCSRLWSALFRKPAAHMPGLLHASQVWILAAQFEIRQLQLTSARKILGTAIGMCPKARLFKEYIALELQLGNVDRFESVCHAVCHSCQTCNHLSLRVLSEPTCSSLCACISDRQARLLQVPGAIQKISGMLPLQLQRVVQIRGDGELTGRG